MSQEPEEQPEEEKFNDPLNDDAPFRGPLFWAAFIFIPLAFSLFVSMFKEPVEAPAVQTPAQQEQMREENPELAASYHSYGGDGRRQAVHTPRQRGEKSDRLCQGREWIGVKLDAGVEQKIKLLRRPYRLLPPGSMMTMDHNPARLNFDLDERGVITRVWCG